MGGMHGFGPVVVPGSEAPYHERWEPRVFAMWAVTGAEGLTSGSGRVLRERMPPEEYLRASYYERWQWSNERRLLAAGTIAEGDVGGWVERLRAGELAPTWADPTQSARVLRVVRTESEELAAAGGDPVRVRQPRPCAPDASSRPHALPSLCAGRRRRRRERARQPSASRRGAAAAEVRYLVVPERPAGTDGWSEDELVRRVPRDAMIGTAKALEPAVA